MNELENNKYWKYISTLGERAVIYNNKIDNEIGLFKDLSKSDNKYILSLLILFTKFFLYCVSWGYGVYAIYPLFLYIYE